MAGWIIQWRGAGITPHKQRIRPWFRDTFFLKTENVYEDAKTRSFFVISIISPFGYGHDTYAILFLLFLAETLFG